MSTISDRDREIEVEENQLYETNRYRCLFHVVKYHDNLYHVSCGIERCRPGKLVDMQRAGYHLHVVLKGKGYLTVNQRRQEVHAGDLFLIKPEERSVYQADAENPWVYCWVTFDGLKGRSLAELSGFEDGVNVLHSNLDVQEFLQLVQKMMDHSEMNLADDMMRMGLTYEYIALAIESYHKENKGNRKYREYSQEDYVSYAVNFIDHNYATISVEDVAKTIGIHRSHLASIFKKQKGISPQEYLMNVRMKEGCKLLRETQMPIQEVAASIGYDNPLTFSKMFKRFFAMSPREYRNAGEGEDTGEEK